MRPGDKGLSIIDGHLNGPKQDGVFIHLDRLKVGSEYTVEFGDGSRRTFRVVSVESVPLDKAVSALFSQNPKITNQLTLITCGGEYDKNRRLYDERVIIVSQLVKP